MKRVLVCLALLSAASVATAQRLSEKSAQRWSEKKAQDWYANEPWLVGSDYIPATAINELEMWQADSFDSKRIDLELGWAEGLGMNTMRVFLHDLLWQQDAAGFRKQIDVFLEIADKHKIKPMLVLFDSCWDPAPKLGKQRAPTPGVHNSGWVQSPGAAALKDPAQYARLEAYVRGVVSAFANDPRVLAWDIWNEPDNVNGGSYGKLEPPKKIELVAALLPKAYGWARAANPKQPLTSGVWAGDFGDPAKLNATQKTQIEMSDVISFHNYSSPDDFEKHVRQLQGYHRPILCTEFMARGVKSTFQGILPVAKKYKVAAIIGGWWRERRKHGCRGIRGRSRTSAAVSRRYGITKSSTRTGTRTGRRKRILSGR